MATVIPSVKRFPLLGTRIRARPVLISRRPPSPFTEAFRLLALNVATRIADSPSRALLVMSASPGEGRSLIAANLAIALSEHAKVVLMDRDSRGSRPLRKIFNVEPLASLVRVPEELSEEGIPGNSHGVWLDEAARYTPVGVNGLESSLQQNSRAGTYSIVDSPPALVSSDAFLLAQKVGRVLYVVRRNSQDMQAHRAVREQLRRLDAEVLGLVLNDF